VDTSDRLAFSDPAVSTPTIADGALRSLDPHVIDLDRVVGWIFAACVATGLFIALVIVWFVADAPAWVKPLLPMFWIAVTLALVWHAQRWPLIDFRHTSYKVDRQGIEIHRGVIWRAVINIPRSRVQHIDVSQGPLQRRYGLGTLSVYTAGTEYSQVNLPGLEYSTALAIRDQLLPREADDAV
jgi:membrane protein YdbS with pleckstrin-like domain